MLHWSVLTFRNEFKLNKNLSGFRLGLSELKVKEWLTFEIQILTLFIEVFAEFKFIYECVARLSLKFSEYLRINCISNESSIQRRNSRNSSI